MEFSSQVGPQLQLSGVLISGVLLTDNDVGSEEEGCQVSHYLQPGPHSNLVTISTIAKPNFGHLTAYQSKIKIFLNPCTILLSTLFYQYSTLLEDILIKLITAAALLENDWIFPNLLRNRQISPFLAILLNKTV